MQCLPGSRLCWDTAMGIKHVPDLSRRGYGLRVPAWKTYNTGQAWTREKEREGRKERRWKTLFIKNTSKRGRSIGAEGSDGSAQSSWEGVGGCSSIRAVYTLALIGSRSPPRRGSIHSSLDNVTWTCPLVVVIISRR